MSSSRSLSAPLPRPSATEPWVDWGKAVAAQLIGSPSDEADVDRAAILLAHCEQVYRAGSAALKGSVGRALDAAADGQEFADAIDAPSLADLRCLMLSNAAQLDVWREQIAGGERCWAGEWTW